MTTWTDFELGSALGEYELMGHVGLTLAKRAMRCEEFVFIRWFSGQHSDHDCPTDAEGHAVEMPIQAWSWPGYHLCIAVQLCVRVS